MVCSNPHDALVEQVLVATERNEGRIRSLIANYEAFAAGGRLRGSRLSSVKASLAAAKSALEIVQREQEPIP